MPIIDPFTASSSRVQEVNTRIEELVDTNRDTEPNRTKIKDIMNGGPAGMSRLIGKDISDPKAADMIPVANLMLKANDRLAQKLGKYPRPKIDSPVDDERALELADKRVRIVSSWDRASNMRLQLRQLGRWLPGYAYTFWTLSLRTDLNGDFYPHAEIRDPSMTYPAAWTVSQQPRDVAFKHIMSPKDLERINPEAAASLRSQVPSFAGKSVDFLPRERGGVILGGGGMGMHGPSWANQSNRGVEVWEYVSNDGTYWVLPGHDRFLAYVPNPLDLGPPFVAMKRFAFDKLIGQYDHLIGLMAAIARMNVLVLMAAERGVQAETNVIGQMAHGKYKTGGGHVNYLMQGSKIEKMNDRIPHEVLANLDKLERQARAMATYPVTDDAISPNSFVTGLGLEELKGSVELEVEEYQDPIKVGSAMLDAKRFEMADNLLADERLKMWGTAKGASFSESYRPSQDINGNYETRRIYGILSTWDDPNKLVTGTALMQNEIIADDDLRENIDGLEDHERIKDRIKAKKVDDALMAMLAASAQDPAAPDHLQALEALIDMLPEGEDRERYERIFLQDNQQPETPVEQALAAAAGGGGAGGGAGGAGGGGNSPVTGPPPPTTTILNRITNRSRPTVGVQSVQQAS